MDGVRGNHSITKAIAVVIAGLVLGGCSIIGLVTGLMHDARKPKGGVYPAWQWAKLEPGTDVKVRLTDGKRLDGTFIMIDQVPAYEYSRSYEKSRQSDPGVGALPAIGDSINLTLATAEVIAGTFLGFDQTYDSAGILPWIHLRTQDSWSARRIDVRQVSEFGDIHQKRISIDSIAALARLKRLPTLSSVLLSTNTGLTHVPLDRIDRLYFKGQYGAVQGFFVGLLIDGALIGLTAAMISSIMSDLCIFCDYEPEGTSCPFAYSFNGEQYVREAELFTGSIFRAAQRADCARLDHLAATDGRYQLAVTNERDETEYIDHLMLLAIDHPPESEIVPTFAGTLCAISHPIGPEVATDLTGGNVLDLVCATDEEVWISNPVGRNPEKSDHRRDGIVVQFRRPPATDSVTLVINVRNTVWGASLQNHIVQMLGTDADAWYDSLNSSPAAREALHRMMVLEGMLAISLWDGTTWRASGHVWEVGPSVSKDVALRLSLRGTPGNMLRVRLESTAGLWMINSVRVDYSTPIQLLVTELACDRAVDQAGHDLRPKLSKADNDWHVMPATSDRADISFKVPHAVYGQARTLVLKSTGYYRIHSKGIVEPQPELVHRILTEPGAFGQYSLRLFNEQFQMRLSAASDSARQ